MEISEETKSRLKKIGSVGASYDAVINECIDRLEEVEILVNQCCGSVSDNQKLFHELDTIFCTVIIK